MRIPRQQGVLFLSLSVALFALGSLSHAQIVSPTGTYPPPPGVPLFDISTPYGKRLYQLYMTAQYVKTKLFPLYANHQGEPPWIRSWVYIPDHLAADLLLGPLQAENGDWLGVDNDNDGLPEPVYVEGYWQDDGYVRGHYRALSKPKIVKPYSPTGSQLINPAR